MNVGLALYRGLLNHLSIGPCPASSSEASTTPELMRTSGAPVETKSAR
ncbi:hypothetical protein ACFZCP_44415 [Streptomyces sp. NPDC007971]